MVQETANLIGMSSWGGVGGGGHGIFVINLVQLDQRRDGGVDT